MKINDIRNTLRIIDSLSLSESLDDNIKLLDLVNLIKNKEHFHLLEMLNGTEWPYAVDPSAICSASSEDDKLNRASNIIDNSSLDFYDKVVLDFGCGEGHICEKLLDVAKNVYGYDIVPNKWNIRSNSINFTDNIGTLDRKFDIIILYDVLDHARNPVQVLVQSKNLLNVNGKIYVMCHPWCSKHGSHLYQQINKAYVHLVFSEQELKDMGYNIDFIQKTVHPLGDYYNLFKIANLHKSHEYIIREPVDSFFNQTILADRIKLNWKVSPDADIRDGKKVAVVPDGTAIVRICFNMKIATLVNCHDYPNLVLDTVESIKVWVSDDIAVVIDAHGWDKFSFVNWGTTKVFKGLEHNFHKAPYRSITFGLKKLYEFFPNYDWYVYTEYDCLFTSNGYLNDIKDKTGIACLASDIRYGRIDDLPLLNNIIGKNITDYCTMLGCCVFYSGQFIKKLYDVGFYDRFLEMTKDLTKGEFPGYKQYAFEETLYPTLVKHFGGAVHELGAWRKNLWQEHKYLMRFRPGITVNDLSAVASIVHPLKTDCLVRAMYRKSRAKCLQWHKFDVIENKKLQYIITGTGRCGTVYLANLLNSIGITCGHERIFTNQGCSYKNCGHNSESSDWAGMKQVVNPFLPLDAESSYMAAPYLKDEYLNDAKIIHLVRKPLNVINSFINGLKYFGNKENLYEKFIYNYLPEIRDINNPILKAVYYYIKWNQMIENLSKDKPYFIFRIEDKIDKLLSIFGYSGENYYKNNKCNSVIKSHSMSWHDIPESALKKDLIKYANSWYNIGDKRLGL